MISSTNERTKTTIPLTYMLRKKKKHLARSKEVIGDAIREGWIETGTKNAKIVRKNHDGGDDG